MSDILITFFSLTPLMFVFLILFLMNRWVGIRCKVWTRGIMIMSMIPVLNYFAVFIMFVKAIQNLTKRIDELESGISLP